MVKRTKIEDMAGVLELKGIGKDDPQLKQWLDEHRARKGGKLRIGLGGSGVRVTFTSSADMAIWKARFEKDKKPKGVHS